MARKTVAGRLLQELEPVTISLNTKVPDKWVFVDTETSDIWVFDNTLWPSGHFRRANETERREALEVLQKGEVDVYQTM